MRYLHKLLIAFISLVMISPGAFAQREQKTNNPSFGIAPAGFVSNSQITNAAFVRGNTAYANMVVDTAYHPFVSFDTDQPETLNEINAAPAWLSFAGDFDNENTDFYYIIDFLSGALLTIDVETGDIISNLGVPSFGGDFVTGMACDKTTGIMYVSAADDPAMTYSTIWTINLETAVATLVGQTTPNEVIIDIAIDAAGDMFGFGILNDEAWLIDKTTAEATMLGPLGFNANNGQGMAYDPQEDKIYIAAFNGTTANGELRDFDRVSGASELIGIFPDGVQVDAFAFAGVPETYDTDLGVVTIVNPATGVNLTADEPVTVRIRNYGTTDHSNIEISYSFEGGEVFIETVPGLNAGEIIDYTFATTVDLSEYGTYEIEACILLSGDENPANDCKTQTAENLVPELCFPDFNDGCAFGDGITDFALEEIENFGSGCEDNTGMVGCSQYLELGPATLIPGNTYTFTLASGFPDQHVNIWIDFNDNLLFEADEMILYDGIIAFANINYYEDITIPADANPGEHFMRVMAVWDETYDDACSNYSFGEAEDYMVMISDVSAVNNEKMDKGLLISPNPAIDQVTINSEQYVNSYSIMDINGRMLESEVVESSYFTINVSQYSKGIYFIRLETDDKPIMRKIIVE